ncbi:hypothetical protein QOT17_000153 [Balamuthia mandrillaris]
MEGAGARARGGDLGLCDLLQRLCLRPEKVLNVYQSGSRVFGTATETSDWDFTIVVADPSEGEDGPFLEGKSCPPETSTTRLVGEHILVSPDIDANLFTSSTFIRLVEEQDMVALMCLFLPSEYVWKQQEDFRSLFRLDLQRLRTPVSTISHKAFGYASICHREGQPLKARKNLVHSLRYLHFGIQLAENGAIVDYSVANGYLYDLMSSLQQLNEEDKEEEWKKVKSEYKKLGKQLHLQLEALLPPMEEKKRKKADKKKRWVEKRRIEREAKKEANRQARFERLGALSNTNSNNNAQHTQNEEEAEANES